MALVSVHQTSLRAFSSKRLCSGSGVKISSFACRAWWCERCLVTFHRCWKTVCCELAFSLGLQHNIETSKEPYMARASTGRSLALQVWRERHSLGTWNYNQKCPTIKNPVDTVPLPCLLFLILLHFINAISVQWCQQPHCDESGGYQSLPVKGSNLLVFVSE